MLVPGSVVAGAITAAARVSPGMLTLRLETNGTWALVYGYTVKYEGPTHSVAVRLITALDASAGMKELRSTSSVWPAPTYPIVSRVSTARLAESSPTKRPSGTAPATGL